MVAGAQKNSACSNSPPPIPDPPDHICYFDRHMAVCPLQIPRCLYRERDPVRLRKAERFNALAERLEQHTNSQVEKSNDRIQIFYCGGIALDLRIDEKEVAGTRYQLFCPQASNKDQNNRAPRPDHQSLVLIESQNPDY